MDITAATTLASAIVALVAPALTQAFKGRIPERFTGLVALAVSIVLGVVAIAATNGFANASWGVMLAAVVGVSQAVYTVVNQAVDGKLSKDKLPSTAK
ncbi:hypothetical protein ABKP87_08750 [Bifidobacterium breve]